MTPEALASHMYREEAKTLGRIVAVSEIRTRPNAIL
jgi:hypothetical protein